MVGSFPREYLRIIVLGVFFVATIIAITTIVPSTDSPDISLRDGSLSVDQNQVWERTQSLQDANIKPPRTIAVTENLQDDFVLGAGFHTLMNVGRATFTSSEPGGLAGASDIVYLRPKGAPFENEAILVHEYTHVTQARVGVFSYRGPSWDSPPTTDAEYAWAATTEGSADFVTAAYLRRYMPNRSLDDVEPRTEYVGTQGGNRLFAARYHFGYRYVAHRVDSPTNLSVVYDDPPNTTEQVLHNSSREAEPPVPLSVRIAGHRDDWDLGESDTLGELFVRVALSEQLPESEAATAAAGWGNDRVVPFENLTTARDPLANWSVQEGYAWVLRWDTARDADEFESAFERYLGQRTGGIGEGDLWRDDDEYFRIERASRDSVVVFAGTTRLVENASVVVDGSDAVVRLPAWRPEPRSEDVTNARADRTTVRRPTIKETPA